MLNFSSADWQNKQIDTFAYFVPAKVQGVMAAVRAEPKHEHDDNHIESSESFDFVHDAPFDDNDDGLLSVRREYEGEASCYYSGAATCFEDDEDNDFVSTKGRRKAILKGSSAFLGLHHSFAKRCNLGRFRKAVSFSTSPAHAFENSGSLRAKVKSSVVMMRLLFKAKASALESFAAAGDCCDPEEEDSDLDEECSIEENDSANERFVLERRSSSMQRSIKNYAEKQEKVQQLVDSGAVVVEHQKKSRPIVEVQGNLGVYEHDQLLLRSTIKRSTDFREIVFKLWTNVLEAEKVPVVQKESYFKMFKKISRLILDHEKKEALVLRDAAIDWERDRFMAKECGILPQEASGINFDCFVQFTIFELTDMFTRTCHEDEYIEFVRRLCVGLFVHKNGKLQWRDDAGITYKHWLALRRKKNNDAEERIRTSCLMQLPGRSKSEIMQVSSDKKRRVQAGLECNAKTPVFTSVFVLNETISRIYRGKLVADLFVDGNSNVNLNAIPFDKFTVRYFALQFGSKRAARRHLRVFVMSCKHYISTPELKAMNPRIDLFCTLAGLQLPPDTHEYNPRLASDYFFPALRFLFPNPRMIHNALREGKDGAAQVTAAIVEKASRPYILNYVMGGQLYLSKFKKDAQKLSKIDPKLGKRVINFDFFMLLALDLWIFADGFRSIREKRALNVLRRLFQRRRLQKEMLPSDASVPQTAPNGKSPYNMTNVKRTTSVRMPINAKKSSSKSASKLAKVKALDKKINPNKQPET